MNKNSFVAELTFSVSAIFLVQFEAIIQINIVGKFYFYKF